MMFLRSGTDGRYFVINGCAISANKITNGRVGLKEVERYSQHKTVMINGQIT